MLPPLLLPRLLTKETLEKGGSAPNQVFDSLHPKNGGKLPVPGSGHRRADLGTDLAICTGLHLQELPEMIVSIPHDDSA